MEKFEVGDAVRLTRGVEINPKGTMGVVARVDDDGWIKVSIPDGHTEAYLNSCPVELTNGTYEAIGPHFQGNPYGEEFDYLVPHGCFPIADLSGPRTFESIKTYLKNHEIEGIVFWRNGFPECKIKRSDFGYEWPVKGASIL